MPLHLLSGMRKMPRDGPGRKEGGSAELVPAGRHSVWLRSQSPPPGGGQGQRTDLRVGRGRSRLLGAPRPRGCADPGDPPPPSTPRLPPADSAPQAGLPSPPLCPALPLWAFPACCPCSLCRGCLPVPPEAATQPPPQDPLLPGGAWDPGC